MTHSVSPNALRTGLSILIASNPMMRAQFEIGGKRVIDVLNYRRNIPASQKDVEAHAGKRSSSKPVFAAISCPDCRPEFADDAARGDSVFRIVFPHQQSSPSLYFDQWARIFKCDTLATSSGLWPRYDSISSQLQYVQA